MMETQPVQIPQTLPLLCPMCGGIISTTDMFCPHCGTLLQEKELSIGRQVFVYLISFLLPPFGLVWVPKYLKSIHAATRRIGVIIIILTILSLILSLWVGIGFINTFKQQLNGYSNIGL